MDVTLGTGVLVAVVAICYYIVTNSSPKSKNGLKLPPQLPRLPVVGSLPFLGRLSSLHVCLSEKSKKYGKIFSIYPGSKHILVLNGYEIIREALVKNAAEFAGRGSIHVTSYVYPDAGKGISLIPASDFQRKVRSNCLTVLKTFGMGSRAVMEEKIQEEVSQLLSYIRSKNGVPYFPSPLMEHSTMNIIYNLMFSKRFGYEEKQGKHVTHLIRQIAEAMDAMYDVFPILTRVPPFKQRIANSCLAYDQYLEFCEASVEEGLKESSGNNFIKEYCKLDKEYLENKRDMSVLIRDLVVAGTETTSNQLSFTFILLANNPKAQRRIHEELDAAVPRDRLPSLDDKPKLSYMEAVLLEVYRMRPALPLALPRCTESDTTVGGYYIPAGTEVLVNLWSAQMDEKVWGDPEIFRPERFLDERGQIINKEWIIAFSHGKRSCLGEVLARQEMFLFLSAILQQFTLLPPEGEQKVKDDPVFARSLTPGHHLIRFIHRI